MRILNNLETKHQIKKKSFQLKKGSLMEIIFPKTLNMSDVKNIYSVRMWGHKSPLFPTGIKLNLIN